MAEYFTSDLERPICEDALRDADSETQLDVIETWFRRHFEDLFVRWTATGTHEESLSGESPTGNTVAVSGFGSWVGAKRQDRRALGRY
jgi:hypothetical protein